MPNVSWANCSIYVDNATSHPLNLTAGSSETYSAPPHKLFKMELPSNQCASMTTMKFLIRRMDVQDYILYTAVVPIGLFSSPGPMAFVIREQDMFGQEAQGNSLSKYNILGDKQ
jgi:hypothetical protein